MQHFPFKRDSEFYFDQQNKEEKSSEQKNQR